jgi:hydroxymethylglutaryl-CoA reductase
MPLVAGGAAIAGAAGGFALAASRQGRRRAIQIRSGDLAKAAKEVGNFSAHVAELASELQRARESAAANGKHRSPIEVVLQGLTARR